MVSANKPRTINAYFYGFVIWYIFEKLNRLNEKNKQLIVKKHNNEIYIIYLFGIF